MNLSPQNKIDTGTGLVSLVSLVTLLLIFFVMASSFITPSVLRVNLMETEREQGRIELNRVASVTITKDLRFYVNKKEVTAGTLEGELKSRINGENGVVVLNLDKSVPTEYLVNVTSIVNKLDAKAVIVTRDKE